MDDATCRECGSTFRQKKGRGGRLAYCSDACRKSSRKAHDTVVRSRRGYKKRLTCATCATPIWKGGSSRPQGEAQCAPCRAAAPKARTRDPRTPCIDCSTPSYGVRCRTCADKAKVNPDATLKRETARRRYARDLAAPGLTGPERRRLRERWIQQRRPCAYCPALATSIDHVVPISLGGTHYEGNLVPCCMDCNARKSDLLLSEWRHGKRLPKWRTEIALRPKAEPRGAAAGKRCKVYFRDCVECGVLFASRSASCWRCVNHRQPHSHPSPDERRRPCRDCGVDVPYKTRPVASCQECRAERARAARRERRRKHGKGKCRGCGGPRWGKHWCQECYAATGGGLEPLAA